MKKKFLKSENMLECYANYATMSAGVVEISVGQQSGSSLQFSQANYTASIREHAAVSTPVITVTLATLPASPPTFSFATGNNNNAFSINNQGMDPVIYLDCNNYTLLALIILKKLASLYLKSMQF